MGSFGATDAEKSNVRTRRRSQDHERDLLRAAHRDAVARFAGTLWALHDGVQSLQPLVSTRHLEADFQHAGIAIARQPVSDRQHDRESPSCGQRSKRGEQNQAIGISRGGRTTKIHAIVDSKGRPLNFTVTGGQVHDSQVVGDVLDTPRPPLAVTADREKMKRITRILRRLGPDDRFFSVDEYGPFSVRQHGGRRRVRRGEYPTIPQYQKSLGYLIVTAALELSTNQVTHFFSKKKDTEEMITLMRRLIEQYSGCRRVYFSWDAASWHSSKRFLAEVRRVNKLEYRNTNQTPMVKLAPLPCRAQFLNVIESVFNGMSISIIHNSDYESVDAAKAAIDRYFGERNSYFKQNPKRAGNKIWGDELVPSKFSESNNCKNPQLMSLANVR